MSVPPARSSAPTNNASEETRHSSERVVVRDEGNLRRFYTVIPNLALDDSDLDPYAFRLLAHYRRVAGENSTCFQSWETIAAACRMSITKAKEARQTLIDLGYIAIEEESRGRNTTTVRVLDRWNENMRKYTAKEAEPSLEPVATQPVATRPVATRPARNAKPVATRPVNQSPHDYKEDPSKKNPVSKNNPYIPFWQRCPDGVEETVWDRTVVAYRGYAGEHAMFNQFIHKKLASFLDDYGIEWIECAFERSSGAMVDRPSLNYAEGILKRWKAEGGPEADEQRRRDRLSAGGHDSDRGSVAGNSESQQILSQWGRRGVPDVPGEREAVASVG